MPKHIQRDSARILIVDDIPQNLRLLSAMLSEHNYEVRYAVNGRLAIEAARLSPPDLILLDISMPGMNGYEVCEALKSEAATRHIPVVFLSARDDLVDKVKAFAVGGVDYITKPFQSEEVLARVHTHLTLSHLQRHLEQLVIERTAELAAANEELTRLNNAYGRFVPHDFLALLEKESVTDVELGDQAEHEMTVLFATVRAFTKRLPQMTAQEHFNFINSYLSRISPTIRHYNGFIDRYIGDSLIALFPGKNHPNNALQAALRVMEEVTLYNIYREMQADIPVEVSIGLHTGQLLLGMIGEPQRIQSAILSEVINVAAYLETLTRTYGMPIIASADTISRTDSSFTYCAQTLDTVAIAGVDGPLAIYGIRFDDAPHLLSIVDSYTITLV